MKIKMYCIVSAEAVKAMKGSRGKLASQAGHAYLHAWWDAHERFPEVANAYNGGRAYKITLVVENEARLRELEADYAETCGVSLVLDAALTVFDHPTVTCLGIGPIREEDIGENLRALKVFQ